MAFQDVKNWAIQCVIFQTWSPHQNLLKHSTSKHQKFTP
jgi:hypothetical protein